MSERWNVVVWLEWFLLLLFRSWVIEEKRVGLLTDMLRVLEDQERVSRVRKWVERVW